MKYASLFASLILTTLILAPAAHSEPVPIPIHVGLNILDEAGVVNQVVQYLLDKDLPIEPSLCLTFKAASIVDITKIKPAIPIIDGLNIVINFKFFGVGYETPGNPTTGIWNVYYETFGSASECPIMP